MPISLHGLMESRSHSVLICHSLTDFSLVTAKYNCGRGKTDNLPNHNYTVELVD